MRWGLILIGPVLIWPLLAGAQSPGRELSIEEAVRIALEHRAELQAATHSIEAREAATRQAAKTLNPILSIQTENWRFADEFSASRDIDFFVYASQQIETGGKRRLRVAAAESDREAAEAEGAVLRWRLTNAVREAWWRAAGAAEQARLREAALESSAELVRYHQARVSEGAAAPVDLLRVQVEHERRKSEAETARTQAEQAALALLRQMGDDAEGPIVVSASPRLSPAPSSAELVEQALCARPDLGLERSFVARAQADVELQRSHAKPDVTPYFGYKRTGAFDTLIGGGLRPAADSQP